MFMLTAHFQCEYDVLVYNVPIGHMSFSSKVLVSACRHSHETHFSNLVGNNTTVFI